MCLVDDILVYGSTQEEHDERLKAVLEQIRDADVTLSEEKSEFHLGQLVDEKGVRPDPQKVGAIQEMKLVVSFNMYKLVAINVCLKTVTPKHNSKQLFFDLCISSLCWCLKSVRHRLSILQKGRSKSKLRCVALNGYLLQVVVSEDRGICYHFFQLV